MITNFDNFVETVCEWTRVNFLSQVSKTGGTRSGNCKVSKGEYAVKVIREWNEILCGFGAYSVHKVFFQAGLYNPLFPKVLP